MPKVTEIQNEAELDAALERIGVLLRSKEGTPEFEELQTLTELVIAYEAIHYPIPDPSPTDQIQGRMDALGLFEDDLIPCLGSRETVDAVLAGRYEITPPMAEALSQLLRIDAADLLPTPAPVSETN